MGAAEMGQQGKCLPHKHEELSSDLQHHMTNWTWWVQQTSVTLVLGPEIARSPELRGQHSSQLVSSGIGEDDFSAEKQGGDQ